MKITLDFENKEVTVLTKCTVEELKQTLKSLKLDPVWWKLKEFCDYYTYPWYSGITTTVANITSANTNG